MSTSAGTTTESSVPAPMRALAAPAERMRRLPPRDPAGRPKEDRAMQDVEAIVLMIVCLGLMFGFIAGFERL
jgi:hypothetical protein